MNGIRISDGIPEYVLFRIIQRWLARNEDSFQTIYLIDKRGGFNQVPQGRLRHYFH